MRFNFNFKKKLKNFFFFSISLLVVFQANSQIINALSMENYQNETVTEELRLKVPIEAKEVWLKAEKSIWDSWLSGQEGFLGRQIFWNKEKEEALILVNWKSKKLWKSIPMSEVNIVQEKFEDNVKTALNVNENPFELIHEGELYKQG